MDHNLTETLTEATLTPKELNKVNSKTQEPRVDILKRLVTSSTPFELKDGSFFVVTDVQGAIDEINNFNTTKKPFNLVGKTTKGKDMVISSSLIKKSDVFGGGKGSGGGAASTALVESAQCYYCSAAVNVLGKAGLPNEYTDAVLKKAAKWVRATESVETVINDLDEVWTQSSILSANELINKGFISVGMTFHRGDAVMDRIYKNARLAFKQTGLKPLTADKWNPGDIWAIAPGKENTIKFNASSIGAYNEGIKDAYNIRDCVSISLKKVVGSASLTQFNAGNDRPNYTPIQFSLRGGSRNSATFSSSTKVIMHFNGGRAEGRTFNFLENWAWQIIGKHAAGGKVGFGPVEQIFKLHKLSGMPDHKGTQKLAQKPTPKFINEFYKMYLNIGDDPDNLTPEEFSEFILDKAKNKPGQNYIYSKYVGTAIMYAIKNAKKKAQADAVVNDIILYAASNTSLSGAFVKVS
jgi:hypothetical protein